MNIGVFFGSRSPEHEVSIITAELIISGLKKLNHNVYPIYINKQGEWLIGKLLGNLKIFSDDNNQLSTSLKKYYLDLEKSKGKIVFKSKKILGEEIIIDLAFPAFHGSFGEDGKIQGLFEMFDIPYVGCNVTSSAVSMDKILTKLLLKSNNFPITEFIYFSKSDWEKNKNGFINEIETKLEYPLIVKPSKLGSSIGITKVKNKSELENAIEVALHYDLNCLIENCVDNLSDITCAVIGNSEPTSSLLQESFFQKDLFSYEDKYLNDGGSYIGGDKSSLNIPAKLDKTITEKIQNTAIQVYKYFGLSGISRIDFLYDKTKKEFYVNEINPLPGTLYHHLWEKSGIPLDKLLTILINLAIEKHQEKKSLIYTFKSDILKLANSTKLKK